MQYRLGTEIVVSMNGQTIPVLIRSNGKYLKSLVSRKIANKTMHKTKPARRSSRIIARHKGLGGITGFFLPLTARDLLVIVGVSELSSPIVAKVTVTHFSVLFIQNNGPISDCREI